MAWVYLVFSGLLECAWAIGLKHSDGFSKLGPSLFTVITMIASFALLTIAVRDLPVGTAYAVWVGIGAFGTAILGIVLFDESVALPRLICLAGLALSVVGLKITS